MTFFERFTARSVLAVSGLLTATSVLATNPLDPCDETLPGTQPCTTSGSDGIVAVIAEILKFVLNVMGILAVAYIIIAGIRLIVSQGDEEQREKAKKTILYVAIGLLVIIFARVIVGFVVNTAPELTSSGS